MHIILKNHVAELVSDFGYSGLGESKLFEVFCNYCVVSRHFLGRFDPKEVTTESDDAAIDGIAVVIDGDLITTIEDAEEVFKTHKTNLLVDVVFMQAKSGEAFQKAEIANFKMGLEDFLSFNPELPNGELNETAAGIIKVVLANLKRVRNRRPNAHVYYCTSGTYKAEREIKAAFDVIARYMRETEYFFNIAVTPAGRGEILKYYADLSDKNEAKLTLIDYFGMPSMPGIPQSYVGVVSAKDYVEALLVDSDGVLKQSVFEENVRSFLGLDNDVNTAIQGTLKDDGKKKLFSVLNNGITIVAPEIALTPNTREIHLTNYQIINGCQTSSTLQANRELLTNDVNVVIKFIESPDNGVSGDIISATNSQSDISKEAFYGLRSKAKLTQKYFDAKNQHAPADGRIYFERRQGEFRGQGLQISRTFDVKEIARCYAAMFLNQPHNAARYVSTIFAASGDNLFKEDDHESYYYCAALALYKYQTLINGRRNGAHNYLKVRWHIIQVFKWFAHGNTQVPEPNSKKADAYASKMIDVLHSDDRKYIPIFEKCQRAIDEIGMPTSDSLKRGRFSQDLADLVRGKLAK